MIGTRVGLPGLSRCHLPSVTCLRAAPAQHDAISAMNKQHKRRPHLSLPRVLYQENRMSSVLFHVMRGLEIGCWTPPLYFTRRTLLQIVDGASQDEAGRTQYRRSTGSFEKPYSMRGMRRAFPSLSTDCAGLRCFGGSQSYKKKNPSPRRVCRLVHTGAGCECVPAFVLFSLSCCPLGRGRQ